MNLPIKIKKTHPVHLVYLFFDQIFTLSAWGDFFVLFCFAFYEGSCKSAHVKTLLNIHVYRHLAFLSSEDKKGLEENHQNWKKNLVLTVISTTIYIRSSFYFFLCMLPALVSCTDYCVQQLSNISDMKYTEDIYCSVGTNNVKWSG